jgi:hypothetical protein
MIIIMRTAAPTIHTHGSTVVVSVVTELLDLVDVVVLELSCAFTIALLKTRKSIAYKLFNLVSLKVSIEFFV